jgi:hypothetical protein
MSTLYIAEFSNVGHDGASLVQAATVPPTATQTVSFTGTPGVSAAFANNTQLVRIQTDGICSIKFGTAPTAATTDMRMAADQTEYFTVPLQKSYKVSAITNT